MLTLRGVSKRFGSRTVLRGVDMSLNAGTLALLVGPNGAGKSTLLRIMAGLIPPDTGTVERDCTETELAYLGHDTFLYGGLTALENLAFWERLHGGSASEAALMAVLKRVGLERFADARAGVFSRGMAQRLNLARVLLRAPRLLLLDEPGTGLDARSLATLRNEVAALRAQGAAVVWISHDLAGDLPMADHVLELANRTLAYAGPAGSWPGREALSAAAPAGGTSC